MRVYFVAEHKSKPCLYCDEPSGSLEHVLAAGIGGHYSRRDLLCETHNGLCGKWADKPLCDQFAFAVHALEVLKGDKTLGTTLAMVASNGAWFDVLPDFRFRLRQTVERPDGGFRVTATEESAFRRIGKQLAEVAEFTASHREVRRYDFTVPVSTTGAGQRGILKAALHFVASITSDRDRARDVCRRYSDALYSDSEPDNVISVPYEVGDDGRNAHRHEMLAWMEDDQTLVRVKIFNVVTYLVRVPNIAVQPTVFSQNTRDGTRSIGRTMIPHLVVDERIATPEGFQKAFAERVNALVILAAYKSDIADVLELATTESLYRMAIGEAARAGVLNEFLREELKLRNGLLANWMARDLVDFANRRIRVLTRSADGH